MIENLSEEQKEKILTLTDAIIGRKKEIVDSNEKLNYICEVCWETIERDEDALTVILQGGKHIICGTCIDMGLELNVLKRTVNKKSL